MERGWGGWVDQLGSQGLLPAWHHIMLAQLPSPGRKLLEGMGGCFSYSWEIPQTLLARGISGGGGGSCRLGWGWGLRTACLPRLLPKAPKQRRLHQPLPGESWEAVVLSHPASVTSQKPLHPPNPQPSPWGEFCASQSPVQTRVRGTPHPL